MRGGLNYTDFTSDFHVICIVRLISKAKKLKVSLMDLVFPGLQVGILFLASNDTNFPMKRRNGGKERNARNLRLSAAVVAGFPAESWVLRGLYVAKKKQGGAPGWLWR